jgi:hypothetical protein
MPEAKVGLDSIESRVLQFVGAKLFHQANAPAFLIFIEKNSCTLFSDAAQSKMKLIVAVATKRVKDISSSALRVNADKGRLRVNVSENQRECGFEMGNFSALLLLLERQ